MSIQLTISETKNYDQFKQIKSNREINMRHVRDLADSIEEKNLLHLNPIICNSNLEVIDGQHRLEAARLLSIPIYFVKEQGLSEDDICHVNRNQKNWTIPDYITFYSLKKKPGFDVLARFMRKNSLDWSIAVRLLSGKESHNRKNIMKGIIDISNEKMANHMMTFIGELTVYGTFARSSRFLTALSDIVNDDEYDHEKLIKALKKSTAGWKEQVKKADYVELILSKIKG